MKVKTVSTRLVIVISFCALLSGVTVYSLTNAVTAADSKAHARSIADSALLMAPKSSAISAPGLNLRSAPSHDSGSAVTEWNQQALTLTLLPASALSPVQQTRVMAIFQVSVHDAVNGITGKYATYLSPGRARRHSSAEAAAIAAAHHALTNLFPSHVASLDAFYLTSLASRGLSENDRGIAYGRSAAAAVLAARANDNSAQAQFDYSVPGAGNPGVWIRINNAPALLPGWGNVTPFVLRRGSQFRPHAPPGLDSRQYARDYNEIKEIGILNSPTRTEEQTQMALFWRASPAAIWNPVLTQVLATREFDLSATARIFALFYLAAADASIACWDAKYTYNFWRPMLAIRGGNLDDNDETTVDPTWTPLLPTPAHPEYPSGHTANSAAMATILASEFNDNPHVTLVVTQTGITRQWFTFSAALDEVIDARIYSGIHFRTADEVGSRLGRRVARYVSNRALRRCHRHRSHCS
jgi:hypothetical protein